MTATAATHSTLQTLASALADVGLTATLSVQCKDGRALDESDISATDAIVICRDPEHAASVSAQRSSLGRRHPPAPRPERVRGWVSACPLTRSSSPVAPIAALPAPTVAPPSWASVPVAGVRPAVAAVALTRARRGGGRSPAPAARSAVPSRPPARPRAPRPPHRALAPPSRRPRHPGVARSAWDFSHRRRALFASRLPGIGHSRCLWPRSGGAAEHRAAGCGGRRVGSLGAGRGFFLR